MLLTVTTTHRPATDLGFLLHKHPERVQSFPQSAGVAHVFYPEATDERCTVALVLEVDPIRLARRGKRAQADGFALASYVGDGPYAAGSMLALALKDVFGTAINGRCQARPELVDTPIPLQIHVPSLPCRGGAGLLRRLVEPLGWLVRAAASPLDPGFPEWGDSPYLDVHMSGEQRLSDALRQLYVLLPVLDDAKHYWVSEDEVDKLVRAGKGWLAEHPDRALITHRYLAHQPALTRSALARLAEVDDASPAQFDELDEPRPHRSVPLADQRRGAVLAAVRTSGATSVGDFGCGEGALVRDLLAERALRRIVAVDVSARALQIAAQRLHLDRMGELERARLEIFQSALTYRDERLAGLDAAVLMEVIEHVDPPRLAALERCVFGFAAPGTVVVTTPNAEHNVRYESLAHGTMRHRDHRFEWTRAQFRAWADHVCVEFAYTAEFLPVGEDDPEVGPPTQLAIFTKSTS